MTAFLFVAGVIFGIRAVGRFMCLSQGDYPRQKSFHPSDDVASLVVHLGLVAWACALMFGGKP
jgi:hypothetical protein